MSKKVKVILFSSIAVIVAVAIALSVTMCNMNSKKPTGNNGGNTSSVTSDAGEVENGDDTADTDGDIESIGDLSSGIEWGEDEEQDDILDSIPFEDEVIDPNEDTVSTPSEFEDNIDSNLPDDGLEDEFDDSWLDDILGDGDWEVDWGDDLEDLSYGKYTNPIQCYGDPVEGNSRKISVDVDNVVWDDFYGLGSHAFTAAFAYTDRNKYNEPLFEFDMNREKVITPSVYRMHFQLEYMITDTEEEPTRRDIKNNKDYQNYLKGIYDFESPEMLSTYKYLDEYKKNGSDIMLNFGWKVNPRITNWYALPVSLYTASAPYDLDAYARACVALVKNFKDRGYDNVKYLTFFNEPNNGVDFVTFGDSVVWFAKMIFEMDEEFKKAGLRDEIGILGPEQGQTTLKNYSYVEDFVEYEGISDVVDYYSFHRYYKGEGWFENNYYEYFNDMLLFNNEWGKRFWITEMCAFGGPYEPIHQYGDLGSYRDWNDTWGSYMIASLNVGMRGVLAWGIGDGYWPYPHHVWHGGQVYIHTESVSKMTEVFQSYEEVGLITNYVTPHCDVLMTDWEGDDIKAAAVKLADGNYTILVETKGGSDRYRFQIDFSKEINKKFYKFQTNRLENLTNDYSIPACREEFDVTDKLTDTVVGTDATFYVYTTKKPKEQISLNKYDVMLNQSGTYEFTASFKDCDTTDLVWSIAAATGKEGTITATTGNKAEYKPDKNAKPGDVIAVRATLKDNPDVYVTGLVEITAG